MIELLEWVMAENWKAMFLYMFTKFFHLFLKPICQPHIIPLLPHMEFQWIFSVFQVFSIDRKEEDRLVIVDKI